MPIAPDLTGSALHGRYELHALIGEGAFGRVYEGRDRRLERPVAIKVIKPWWAEDPEWVDIFQREARLLARVSNPGIVAIYDVGHAPEGLYYVSELVDGENLADRLRRGPLPAWEAAGLAVQLCRALAGAHAHRVVHRDVKPANILLGEDGRVKIGDFGVARLAEGSTDGAAATVVGTPRYMAPEQGRGLATSPATDIYSVGVVLYEMLAGAPPFSGGTAVELALRHLDEAPPPLPESVPVALRLITMRALAKDPAARFPGAGAMADALTAARDEPAGAVPARSPERISVHRASPVLIPGARGAKTTTSSSNGNGDANGNGNGNGNGWDGAVIVTPAPHGPESTRRAIYHARGPAVNPSGRRRAVAALVFVALLIGAMAIAAVALNGPARTRVPRLIHLRAAAARTRARRAHVRLALSGRYSTRPAGTIVSQRPSGGSVVGRGSEVRAVLSRGLAPVNVPGITRENVTDALHALRSLGLRPVVRQVPAPGVAPGTVTAQTPGGGLAPAHSTVTLSVAETPQWHAGQTFSASQSGPLRIIGARWRLTYSMSFNGICEFILFCSGPTARVIDTTSGRVVARFGLSDGSGQTQNLATGPGTYAVQITQGGDPASWSMAVSDDY